MTDFNELYDYLKRVSLPTCPACQRKTTWLITVEDAVPTMLALVPTVKGHGQPWKGSGVPAVFMVCELCGFVRLHAFNVLQEIVKDAKKKGGNGAGAPKT